MHDGTQFAAYMVWKITSTNPDDLNVLLDTGGVSSTTTGFTLNLDDRSGVPREDNARASISKSSVGNYEADALTTTESAVSGNWHISAVKFDASDLVLWNDGHWGGTGTDAADGAPSASNPGSALYVGGRNDNTFNHIGDWARILIISGSVSDANHKAIQDYLSEEYAIYNLRYFGTVSVVEHDTSGQDENAFVGLGQAPNGDLIIGYSKTTSHASADGDLIIKISSDGGATWGSEQIIWDYSVDGGGTDIWFTPRFTTMSDGRIFMSVGKRESAASVVDGIGYFVSNDNGQSWSGPNARTEATFTNHAQEGGGILVLANGDWLYPYFGRDTGDAADRRSCRVLKSSNLGSTWSNLATVADGPTDGKDYSEIGLVQISNDDVIALIREEDSATIYTSTSSDDGATWGAASEIADATGLPAPLLLSTGEIISLQRDNTGTWRGIILFSDDEGTTWQLGYLMPESPNATGAAQWLVTYGQFVEDADGTIYLGYGYEFNGASTSDVLFTKTG
jgi:hypothetical protein